MFSEFGSGLQKRIREHHESNGGVSRFEKIPLYLNWAGQSENIETVNDYCLRFSKTVFQKVIDSPWVPGVQRYLRLNSQRQSNVLVTATPQKEIEEILSHLRMMGMFKMVFGAPVRKSDAIREVLQTENVSLNQACMIGDSDSDYDAAAKNGIQFVLRKTQENVEFQKRCKTHMISDFLNE
ncbi:HAD-hyrolase-like protein [Leptospira inadai serovar Lyme str. 10]|uniref:HAD-hyrolase-like protein n=1 Tax=Leptospira inadai serovar Lyme str. 10 TaxID=1049790 RepID=V6HCN0_9LEPT|nr:HAD-hyrolase-like protein [Leptospira inadai serovar Lyme str. 10]